MDYPGAFPEGITVGALTEKKDLIAYFSSKGFSFFYCRSTKRRVVFKTRYSSPWS